MRLDRMASLAITVLGMTLLGCGSEKSDKKQPKSGEVPAAHNSLGLQGEWRSELEPDQVGTDPNETSIVFHPLFRFAAQELTFVQECVVHSKETKQSWKAQVSTKITYEEAGFIVSETVEQDTEMQVGRGITITCTAELPEGTYAVEKLNDQLLHVKMPNGQEWVVKKVQKSS